MKRQLMITIHLADIQRRIIALTLLAIITLAGVAGWASGVIRNCNPRKKIDA